eukprot:1160415-Pelagomonas_calceolata.AAC.10
MRRKPICLINGHNWMWDEIKLFGKTKQKHWCMACQACSALTIMQSEVHPVMVCSVPKIKGSKKKNKETLVHGMPRLSSTHCVFRNPPSVMLCKASKTKISGGTSIGAWLEEPAHHSPWCGR